MKIVIMFIILSILFVLTAHTAIERQEAFECKRLESQAELYSDMGFYYTEAEAKMCNIN